MYILEVQELSVPNHAADDDGSKGEFSNAQHEEFSEIAFQKNARKRSLQELENKAKALTPTGLVATGPHTLSEWLHTLYDRTKDLDFTAAFINSLGMIFATVLRFSGLYAAFPNYICIVSTTVS